MSNVLSESEQATLSSGGLLDRSRESKRPAWRERLVQAERGLALGLRNDSIFAIHLFTTTLVVMTGIVLEISWIQWGIISLAITVSLVSEIFHQVLKHILPLLLKDQKQELARAIGLSTAAVMLALAGTIATILLVLGERIDELF